MSLAEKVSMALRQKNLMMASAESCTGGMVAAAMTDLAGSSGVFDRGFITYSNQSKIDLLGVPASTIEEFGAVSQQTALAMTEGALRNSAADLAIAVTGIAGPSGGTPDKPVGLVYIGVGLKGKEPQAYKHNFNGTRSEIRYQSIQSAFTHILDLIEVHHA